MTNKYSKERFFRTLLLVLLLINFTACNRNRNNPGWDYFPDMFYSTAYETNSGNPNFENGSTMRTPVEGTIPREFAPFEYTNDPESRIKAGKELMNPFKPTNEVILSGKVVYSTFCIGCHGTTGAGDGHLFTSGLYPLKPLSISGENAAKLKDGEIFHTITLGIRSMGAHGSQIIPDDRWKLILYIRKLQKEVDKESGIRKNGNK